MCKYYEMDNDNFCDYGVRKNPDLSIGTSFLAGRYITEQLPNMVLEVNFPASYRLPHFLGNAIPIASTSLVDVIHKAEVNNIQTFPVLLINPDIGEEWLNYVALNVYGTVSAVDLNRSRYDTLARSADGTPLLAFHELFLDKSKLNGEKMFRLAESRRTLIVHDSVVDQLKKHRPEGGWGIDVIELED